MQRELGAAVSPHVVGIDVPCRRMGVWRKDGDGHKTEMDPENQSWQWLHGAMVKHRGGVPDGAFRKVSLQCWTTQRWALCTGP